MFARLALRRYDRPEQADLALADGWLYLSAVGRLDRHDRVQDYSVAEAVRAVQSGATEIDVGPGDDPATSRVLARHRGIGRWREPRWPRLPQWRSGTG